MDGRPLDRDRDLRRQHEELLRAAYDGHRRRGGIVTIAVLTARRRRRLTRHALRAIADAWTPDQPRRRSA